MTSSSLRSPWWPLACLLIGLCCNSGIAASELTILPSLENGRFWCDRSCAGISTIRPHGTVEGVTARFEIGIAGTGTAAAGVWLPPIQRLVAGRRYLLSFAASSAAGLGLIDVCIGVEGQAGPPLLHIPLVLERSRQEYQLVANLPADLAIPPQVGVGFLVGNEAQTIEIGQPLLRPLAVGQSPPPTIRPLLPVDRPMAAVPTGAALQPRASDPVSITNASAPVLGSPSGSNLLVLLAKGQLKGADLPGHLVEVVHGEASIPEVVRWSIPGKAGDPWDAGGVWPLQQPQHAGTSSVLLVTLRSRRAQAQVIAAMCQTHAPFHHWYDATLKIPDRWTTFRLHLVAGMEMPAGDFGFHLCTEFPGQVVEMGQLVLIATDQVPAGTETVVIAP